MLLMGRTLPEILMAKDTVIFLLQHLGFMINLKKSALRNRENDFCSFGEKNKTCVLTMSEDFQATKNFSLKFTKLIGLLSSTVQTITGWNPVSISSAGANISSTEKKGPQWSCGTGNLARDELLWWMENLKLCNGRKIQQREPHMIIQTDDSTKCWGHTAREFR